MEDLQPGALYLVSTPIGNLADISFRAIHILKNVDYIAAEDTRVTRVLLTHYQIQQKLIPYHSYNQKKQTPLLIRDLLSNKTIALVSDAGTPGISDPAYVLVREAIRNNIPLIPIPGASALLAALIVSGLPVNRFVFEGFLPLKKGRKTKIEALASESRTIVIYESPHRIKRTLNDLIGCWGNRPCVMAREITKKFEEFYRGNLIDLKKNLESKTVKGEIVLIIDGAR
jgi:16S rRNA (cytidine1402-2'-O)-methyltransferase